MESVENEPIFFKNQYKSILSPIHRIQYPLQFYDCLKQFSSCFGECIKEINNNTAFALVVK